MKSAVGGILTELKKDREKIRHAVDVMLSVRERVGVILSVREGVGVMLSVREGVDDMLSVCEGVDGMLSVSEGVGVPVRETHTGAIKGAEFVVIQPDVAKVALPGKLNVSK
jgi:hypothetical protein